LESNIDRAALLSAFELASGDARLLTREVEAYLRVTAEDVRAAVSRFLTRERRNDVTILPAGEPGRLGQRSPVKHQLHAQAKETRQ
jgi:predicted Zn-dependent peptidase